MTTQICNHSASTSRARRRESPYGVLPIETGTSRYATNASIWLIACVLSCFWGVAAAETGFTRMVVFGDSLSDPGNFFTAIGETARQPYEPVPAAPYDIGGHHFSNGETWIEQLSRELGIPTSGEPALRMPGEFTNYAVGRARARPGAPVFPLFDLSTQVGLFLGDFGGAPEDAVYVVWIGSNDLSDALNALATDPSGATSFGIIANAITAVSDNIFALWASGARTFLVPNLPNPALTPVVRAQGPVAQFAATQLSVAYNAALDQALQALSAALSPTQIIRLDTFGLLNATVASPPAGLSNVDDPCLSFGVIGEAICEEPNRHLFWDGFHPTERGHRVLRRSALAVLSAP